MPSTSPLATLVSAINDHSLLEASQQEELNRSLRNRCRDADTLALELVRRQWLTPFQAERLLKGKGEELVLGPYVLLALLGQGAMGEVYKARHQLMNRVVALKVIRKDWLKHSQAVQRFRREVRAIAQVTHPNIVIAHDAAQIGDTWLLAMEYVAGTDLNTYVQENGPLPVPRACELVRQTAVGLQHAHEKGLVHRDIKPANLLLTEDGSTVKILDLGLALLQSGDTDRLATLTQEGAVMGTPAYIAPEQAMDAHKADIRSDIYALGCTFFFFLTGRAPFLGKTLAEILVKHQHAEPPPIESLRPDAPPEVRAIVRRMMAKKPADRYQTPAEVAAALAPLTTPGRRPAAAPREEPRTFEIHDTATESDPNFGPHSTLVEAPPARTPLPPPPQKRGLAGILLLMVILSFAGFLAAPAVLRLAQEHGLIGASTQTSAADSKLSSAPDLFDPTRIPAAFTWPEQPKELVAVLGERDRTAINGLAFSPNGKWLATPGPGNAVIVWDLANQRKKAVLQGHTDTIKALAFSPDGKILASGSDDGSVRLWDGVNFDANARDILRGHAGWVNALAFSPDGKRLVTGSGDSTVRLWDLSGKGSQIGESLREHTSPVYAVAFSPDGKVIASGSSDMSVRLWDAATGKSLDRRSAHFSSVNALAFSLDGKTLASGSSDHNVILWDRDVGRLTKRTILRGHEDYVFALASGPGERLLVSADPGGQVFIWDGVSGEKRQSWKVPGKLASAAFSADGRYVAVGSTDGLIYLFRIKR